MDATVIVHECRRDLTGVDALLGAAKESRAKLAPSRSVRHLDTDRPISKNFINRAMPKFLGKFGRQRRNALRLSRSVLIPVIFWNASSKAVCPRGMPETKRMPTSLRANKIHQGTSATQGLTRAPGKVQGDESTSASAT